MPIYEYRCQCGKRKEILLSFEESGVQKCECGRVMTRLISVPCPAIFISTNRDRLVNTLNDDDNSYPMVGRKRNKDRYKQVIGDSLFHAEKPVFGRGFG